MLYSTIQNSPKLEAFQYPNGEWIKNVVYLYKGILFNNKKELSSVKCCSMNESQKYVKQKKPGAKCYMLIPVIKNV